MSESSPELTPFDLMGGREAVIALAERFYDVMEEIEPDLAALHELDEDGRVARGPRERFGLFLIGWLGGPQDYMAQYGHPRLRMRHARVPVDVRMRDAWVRCMLTAMKSTPMPDDLRAFLEVRFAEVADFLRNVPEAG
ncbi:MAG: group II truncated hemoglobin [Myxococcales bacterium]|jgi:hemoglobin|nr:group II truncated hemoglobin [Myxococcales bacterium]